MKEDFLSLIYPNQEMRNNANIINKEAEKTLFYGNFLYDAKVDYASYITYDENTIAFRQAIFADLLKNSSLCSVLDEMRNKLKIINDLYVNRSNSVLTENQIYSIKQIDVYLDFIDYSYRELQAHLDDIKSEGLKCYSDFIAKTFHSKDFQNLKKNVASLSHEILHMKSVTIAANLNPDLTIEECGIISFNDYCFESADFIDRLLRAEKSENHSVISNFVVTSRMFSKEEQDNATIALNTSMGKVLKRIIRSWEPVIKKFFLTNVKVFIPLQDEINFLLYGVNIQKQLRDLGLPLACPINHRMDEKIHYIKGLYNPVLALSGVNIIKNDFYFDPGYGILLLFGPNNGGKTVFLSAIGIAQVFYQLGFLIPGDKAHMSPSTSIFVNYSKKSSSINSGRFEEECKCVSDIISHLDEYSLVLMDETFSSTNTVEGAAVARDVIAGFASIGCYVIFATHLIEFSKEIDEINNLPDIKTKVSIMISGTDNNGKRNYKFIYGRPDGRSYTRDITEKYGLSYENILSRIKSKTVN